MELLYNIKTPIMMVRVRIMFVSNCNIPIFIPAAENMGQIKWRADSKVAPNILISFIINNKAPS